MRAGGARALATATLAALLAACGETGDSYVVGSGRWNDIDVTVESRPAPPQAGNNEVVVIITRARHQPVYDAVVHVRARAENPWVQAIEDGHVGVYRRAVDFGREGDTRIEVRVQRGSDETTLGFPVRILSSR